MLLKISYQPKNTDIGQFHHPSPFVYIKTILYICLHHFLFVYSMKRIVGFIAAFFIGQGIAWGQSDSLVYVARYKGDKACAISYTFDDGLTEQYTLAAPELEKRGFRGTFFINGSKVNENGKPITDTTRVTWGQLKEMAERGHEVANHGWAHRNFARFPLEELKKDILQNDSAIKAHVGIPSRTFAYPNNNKSEPGKSYVMQGRTGTRLTQWSVGSKRSLEDLNRWADTLLKNKDWGVGMTHGLTYGYDAFGDPSRLWKHWDYVKSREDSIWVATFVEVAAYVKERDSIQLVTEQTDKGWIVTPVLNLNQTLFDEPLTLVVCVMSNQRITARQDGKSLEVTMQADKALFDFNPYGSEITINY